MPTIAPERQIYADLLVGRPDGVTWESLREYLASVTVELGDISGIGTGQSGVDGVVRRANFVLRNDRTLSVLIWPADGIVSGDRVLAGDDTVDGAATDGSWLARLLDQTPDYYGDSFAPRDRLSAWNQFDVDGDGTPEYAPLLWPNREVILLVRIDGPAGQGTTAVVDDFGMADGATRTFALSKRPVAESSETVTQKLPYRWTDYADKTWAELTDRTWVDIKEEQELARGVDYTIDYEAGTITFATTPEAGVFLEAIYAYWVTLFHGLLGDSIRTSGPTVECDARDLAKRLQDTYILTPREYGSEAGTPAEDVIQQIIDDNLGPGEVTLYFPSGTASDPRPIAESPGFMVTPYQVEYMSVWDAIQQVAAQFGWFLGYRWHPNTGRMQLILMEPPRNKDASTADFYLSWEDDIYTQDLEITDRDIRNVVTVTYRNAATGDRESVTVQDTDSIATYGPRAMQIEEGDASLIDTPEEAQRLANAALADLKDMTATTQLQMPLLPTLDVFSGIVVTDPRLSSTDDFFGVETVRHTLDFEARQFRTEAVAAGRVIGGHHRWLRMQTRPGQAAPPSPERVVGGGRVLPKPTGLVARGILRGVALDVPVPPVNVNRWAATEVHLSETQGFTPSDATRVASGRETHFEIMSGLAAGTTYYLRAFYVDLKGNKSLASDEVSALAGHVTPIDINPARNVLPFVYVDSLDASTPMTCVFYMPQNVISINSIKMQIRGLNFRAYSKSAIGGAHEHDVMMPFHTHSVSGQTSLEDGSSGLHRHLINLTTGGALGFTDTTDATPHSHDIDYGIFEDTDPTNVSYRTSDNDGSTWGNWTGNYTSPVSQVVDLTSAFTTTAGFKRVQLDSSRRGRIAVVIVVDVNVTSV